MLPVVLPVVLYNGDEPWTAPRSLRELSGVDRDSAVWRYQPECCYYLIDEKRYQGNSRTSLFALICELEQCQTPEPFETLLEQLRHAVRAPRFDALRRAFAAWLQEALLPSKNVHITASTTYDLDEVIAMTNVDFPAQWFERGEKAGLDKGEKIGLDKGEKIGLDKGEKIGLNKGLQQSLCRVYERRFGPMTTELRARIESTDAIETLESWLDAVVTAPEEELQTLIFGHER